MQRAAAVPTDKNIYVFVLYNVYEDGAQTMAAAAHDSGVMASLMMKRGVNGMSCCCTRDGPSTLRSLRPRI